jgi:putative transposon-encoded protein
MPFTCLSNFAGCEKMDEVVIKTTLDRVISKKVGPVKQGQAGAVYLPKEWIGKQVQVILRED